MVDHKLLKNLVPLHNLSEGNLKRLANKLNTEELPTDAVICRESERNDYSIYLLEGGVELSSQATTMKRVLQGGTTQSGHWQVPAPFDPTQCTPWVWVLAFLVRRRITARPNDGVLTHKEKPK
jgi:hypothetical protein